MNYELAKQLKDAGFLQEENGNRFYCNKQLCGRNYDDCDQEIVRIPTLSELIEACGDGFESLTREPYEEDMQLMYVHWRANHIVGSTPEEAVAKLWLELNEPAPFKATIADGVMKENWTNSPDLPTKDIFEANIVEDGVYKIVNIAPQNNEISKSK